MQFIIDRFFSRSSRDCLITARHPGMIIASLLIGIAFKPFRSPSLYGCRILRMIASYRLYDGQKASRLNPIEHSDTFERFSNEPFSSEWFIFFYELLIRQCVLIHSVHNKCIKINDFRYGGRYAALVTGANGHNGMLWFGNCCQRLPSPAFVFETESPLCVKE
jgi:hypothetical protein